MRGFDMTDEFDVALAEQERDDAVRNAAKIANTFKDLYNEVGEVPEIKAAYKNVETLIEMYAGLERYNEAKS